VTALKAAKFCFPAIVEASGIINQRENRQSGILGLAN
jgi:hypothetical protein